MEDNGKFDVIIIGGSYAGLSAAMGLGRARRNVLIIDSGDPCNKQTPHSHNFLTRDGSTPAEITAEARRQALNYPTIKLIQDKVSAARGENNNFTVSTDSGLTFLAKKILFATGIQDKMPEIEGFAACWGISAIHCPYCHGYEYSDEVTGILINGETALEFSRLIKNWTNDLTIFTNGQSTISKEHRDQLDLLGINVIEKEISKIEHQKGYMNALTFSDGNVMPLIALYARLPFKQHCTLPEELGCEFTEAGHIVIDNFQKTNVSGVYAAGDNSIQMRSVAAAVAAGTMSAAFINHELLL